jgi:hypothetical protein
MLGDCDLDVLLVVVVVLDHGAAGDKVDDAVLVGDKKKMRRRTAGMRSRNDGVVILRMITTWMRDGKGFKYNKDVVSCGATE